ncbi:MAG: hypothetical protein KF775_05440 [Cyclobacteriaceae bacterium]|nr:hypothetical protein [Cyclobacteriaceae bacterium]
MKHTAFLFLNLLILGVACAPKSVEDVPALETFMLEPKALQGEWHMITEIDGEWVLYYPCDADNTFIQLKPDSIVIGWGQDATAGKIENWSVTGNKLTLAVNDSYAVSTYQVTGGNNFTEWWLWEDTDKPSRFILATQKSHFKEVRQPCKECWEDCEEE